MIITTQRSPIAFTIDTVLTTCGWLGFFYLFTSGVISVLRGGYDSPPIPLIEPLLPTLSTLALYLLVGLFNALLVVLWGKYHKVFFRQLNRRRQQIRLEDDILASHFHLSCNQLHEVQDSRVTVIYHSDDGDIARLETDQLRMQPAVNSSQYEAAQVA